MRAANTRTRLMSFSCNARNQNSLHRQYTEKGSKMVPLRMKNLVQMRKHREVGIVVCTMRFVSQVFVAIIIARGGF